MGGVFCYPVEKSYHINGRRYTCTRLLGEGGFSFVYLAKDNHSKKYALKSMLCQTNEALITGNKEIEILLKFDHPNIIKLIDHTTIRSTKIEGASEILMLLPYYKDGTLQDILDRQRTLNGKDCMTSVFNQQELISIFKQISMAVSMFHTQDPPLAHRDLKPGNILMGDQYKPVLMDFGSTSLARVVVESRKQALAIQDEADQHSTPLYRPPELFDVASDCVLDERTDVWALGCIGYAMAFNKSPFESDADDKSASIALSVISGNIDIPQNHPFSPQLIVIFKQMMSLNINDRPLIQNVIESLNNL